MKPAGTHSDHSARKRDTMGRRHRSSLLRHMRQLLLAGTCATLISPAVSAQAYDLEKAEQAKSFFSQCATVAEGAAEAALPSVIETCKTAMNDIAGLFSAYPDHTPMDLNVLAIYSGTTAYIVVAMDMQQHENRLSIDGCNHADHVAKMYDSLTAGTNEDVEAQLHQNAETVKQYLIPWCNDTYGGEQQN